MSNNDRILELFLKLIKREYRDDISLVCCYGSYVNGTANEKSDLDFYFVPRTERAKELSKTFILDGIGYDFWGANWEQLGRIANFDDTFISLVDGAKVVYSRSFNDIERFNSLKAQIGKISAAAVNVDMLEKAYVHINKAKEHYFSLLYNDNIKLNAGNILLEISDAVCIINNSFFRYGTKRQLAELSELKYVPNDFAKEYQNIITSTDNDDVKRSCFNILSSTQEMYDELLGRVTKTKDPYDCLEGLYEEICSNWNKLYFACDSGDIALAYITGIFLQSELDDILKKCGLKKIEFLLKYDSGDIHTYKKAAQEAEKIFVSYLEKYNIPINKYDSISSLEKSLCLK